MGHCPRPGGPLPTTSSSSSSLVEIYRMWKVYHRLKVELVSRVFARRFSRSRGTIEGEKASGDDTNEEIYECLHDDVWTSMNENKEETPERDCCVTLTTGFFNSRKLLHCPRYSSAWTLHGIAMIFPVDKAATERRGCLSHWSIQRVVLSSTINSSFSAPLLKCRNTELFLR